MEKIVEENFIRQRRNLIMISLVLLFAEMSEIEISKINVFGNEIVLKNPETILITLWAAFFYWLVRYYQYFRDINDKGFKTKFHEKIEKISSKIAFKKLMEKKKDDAYISKDGKRVRNIIPSIYKINKYKLTFIKGTVEYLVEKNIDGFGSVDYAAIDLSLKDLFLPTLLSGFHVIFNTRLATEYLLPFCISSFPILYRIIIKTKFLG